jgi:hypothetical protein
MFHIGSGPENSTLKSNGFMEHAKSPNGPWSTAMTHPNHCNNPAPAFHPNGTLFVICNHFQITSNVNWSASPQKTGFQGGWSPLVSIGQPTDDNDRHWEDPTLWFDKRGNWHILYHVSSRQAHKL